MSSKKSVGIDAKVIERAKAAAASGEGKELSFPDDAPDGVSGFLIRVKGRQADWYVRAKINGGNKKIAIASLSTFGEADIPQLRQLAIRIKAGWKTGKSNDDLKVLINEFVAMKKRSVEGAVDRAAVKTDGEWTWEMLRDAYLANLKGMGSRDHWGNFRSALGQNPDSDRVKDFEPIAGLPIKSINLGDLMDVRDNVLRRGGMKADMIPVGLIRSTEMTVSGIRNAFAWAMDNRKLTGLTVNPALGLSPTIKKPAIQKPQLTPEQVEKTVFEKSHLSLEQLYDFLWVWLPKQHYPPRAKVALTLQGLTGQRIATILSAFWIQLRRVHGREAKYMWASGPDKKGGYRVMPLPDWASLCVHEALQLRLETVKRTKRSKTDLSQNTFLFPQKRVRAVGGDSSNHMSDKIINEIFHDARLPGGPLEPKKKPDGTIDKTVFTSHDLRRAFITHMSQKGPELGIASDTPDEAEKFLRLITHKNEGKTSIIAVHYNFSSQERFKLRILRMWESMILGARGEKRRPHRDAFDLNEGEMFGLTQDEWRALNPDFEEIMQEEEDRQRKYGYHSDPSEEYDRDDDDQLAYSSR